jgi:phosphoribosyl 1,2-cyclic phosphodiesterase
MSLELCVLGSGSGGNSTVVRSPWGNFLIDAGFGPRATAQRMHDRGGIGLDVPQISAILLTHLDHDHFNVNWLQTIVKQGIRVFCAKKRVADLLRRPEVRDLDAKLAAKKFAGPLPKFADLVTGFEETFEPVKNVKASTLSLAHDEEGSHGFLLECDGYRVGFATDLGHVPDALIERFCGVDVLALESNYDPEMERNSDRPWYLKQRVMGGKGHLSNFQALDAIRSILDRTAQTCGPDRLPRHIVLLHRSRQCNCPDLVRKLFTKDARISPVLTLTDQFERTGWLSARRPRAQVVEQLSLAFA